MTKPQNPISATAVMDLRARTGAPIMDCKKYLAEAEGDIDKAVVAMRKAGEAKADKKSSRVAAEGVIVAAKDQQGTAVLVEFNSETDFVARHEDFMGFATQTAKLALNPAIHTVEDLLAATLASTSTTVEQERQQLIARIGENIKIRRLHKQSPGEGTIGSYIHGSRIGVLVCVKNGNEALIKGLAMHIAAAKPLVTESSEVSPELIQQEREIFAAQAEESGKPEPIIAKMIDGRIVRFLQEISLVDQPFVKDPTIKVSQLLKDARAEVLWFVRFEVGEGIEKKEDNFVEEVMAQVRDR